MAIQNQYKLTLTTGKTVVFREITIAMKNVAVSAVAAQHPDASGAVFNNYFQDELMRQVLISINGKEPSGAEKENMDSLFTFNEYTELNAGLGEILGGASKKPKIELLIGSK